MRYWLDRSTPSCCFPFCKRDTQKTKKRGAKKRRRMFLIRRRPRIKVKYRKCTLERRAVEETRECVCTGLFRGPLPSFLSSCSFSVPCYWFRSGGLGSPNSLVCVCAADGDVGDACRTHTRGAKTIQKKLCFFFFLFDAKVISRPKDAHSLEWCRTVSTTI